MRNKKGSQAPKPGAKKMTSLSKLAGHTEQSEIRVMSVECDKIRGINLAQGVCDTEVPVEVREGAKAAIDRGMNSYTRMDGIAELRQAIARKMRQYNQIIADPEREVVVTSGSTGAFYSACLALLDPGDEVIIFEPYYGYHVSTLETLQAVPVYVRLRSTEWEFSAEDVERVITPRTKAIVVNTPANPSGKVFSQKEVEWVAECAIRHNLFVFTDEIYEYFVYDGHKHISPGSLSGMAERTITISGLSKTFSVTGWRVGYAVCSPRVAAAIGYFHDLVYVCAPAPLQHGVAVGLQELTTNFYRELQQEYLKKRDLICAALEDAGLIPSVPQGAYYVLADASSIPGRGSKEKAMRLLEMAGVAAVPGDAFFHDNAGTNLLRFCFAKTDRELEEACKRLRGLRSRLRSNSTAAKSTAAKSTAGERMTSTRRKSTSMTR